MFEIVASVVGLVLFVGIMYWVSEKAEGCGGDCNQGRSECNCKKGCAK